MSIKKDKKVVSGITVATGILMFILIMGIVIFSLPDTKRASKDESKSASETTTSQIKESQTLVAAEETEKASAEETTAVQTTTKAETTTAEEETTAKETTVEETTVKETTAPVETTEEETTTEEADGSVTIVALGDNLLHRGIFDYAMLETGEYYLTAVYKNIQKLVSSADISIINQETPVGGIELGLHDYPYFNSPYEIDETLSKLGIDIITLGNNHITDMGTAGVVNTLTHLRTNYPEMLVTGAYLSQEERNQIQIYESKGIKIAILDYTYDLNCGQVEGAIINKFDPNITQIDIMAARQQADFVIVCIHWGNENEAFENAGQESLATYFTDLGADLIIGTHPHVVQSVKTVSSSDNKRTSLCYYSLGNLVSLQHTTDTMLGGIATIKLTKDETGTYISDYDYDFCVTQWDALHDGCRVILWDDYTPELAKEHGMPSFDSSFSYDALAAIVESHKLVK